MSRWIIGPALVLCVLAAPLFGHYLLAEREVVAATPSPRPMFKVTDIPLAAGQRLCISDVTIPRDARRLRFQVQTFGRPGPALHVELRGSGYSEALDTAAGYSDGAVLTTPIAPPAADVLGEVCVRNGDEGPIALVGTTEERTRSRPVGNVDGRPVDPDAYLAFLTGRSASAVSETGEMIERMDAFRPGVVGPWLLWPLLVLVVLGVPGGVLLAVSRAVRA